MGLRRKEVQRTNEVSNYADVKIVNYRRLVEKNKGWAKTTSGTYNFVMLFDKDYFANAPTFEMLNAWLVNAEKPSSIKWIYSGANESEGDSFNDPAYDFSLDNYCKDERFANSQLQVTSYYPVIMNPKLVDGIWDGDSGEFVWLEVNADVNFPDKLDNPSPMKQNISIVNAMNLAFEDFIKEDKNGKYRNTVVEIDGEPKPVKEYSLLGRVLSLVVDTNSSPTGYYTWQVTSFAAADVSSIGDMGEKFYNLYESVMSLNGRYMKKIVELAAKQDDDFKANVEARSEAKNMVHETSLYFSAIELLDNAGVDFEEVIKTELRKPFYRILDLEPKNDDEVNSMWEQVIPHFWVGPEQDFSTNSNTEPDVDEPAPF